MTRPMRLTVAALALLAPAALLARDDKPAEPPAGSWKVYLPFINEEGGSQALLLVKFEKKADKWQGKVVAGAKGWSKAGLANVRVGESRLKFDLAAGSLNIACDVRLPKADDKPGGRLYGAATVGKQPTGVELEPTAVKSLDPLELLRERFEKEQAGESALKMGLGLLGQSERTKADAKAVRATAEKVVRSAGLYGPAFQREIVLAVAATLTGEEGFEKVALEYARRAERGLEAKEPPAAQKRVLDVYIAALEKNKRDEEVKAAQARLAKLDFRIKPRPFAGRKGKGDRAVLVELFTGAQCPPCVAADLAFDALLKTYKPEDVVLLQYHMHVPQPDPLTAPDSEARARFYDDAVGGAPALLLNGKPSVRGGGDREDGPEKYDEYVEAIDPLLEAEAGASLKVGASRKGAKVTINVEVAKLAETGDDVRLRLALVEEEVAYKGANGVPQHHQVVRTMPGGVNGVALKEKTFKKEFTVDVDALRKELTEYLEKVDKRTPLPGKERPLEMKKLKVVAFVQNDKDGSVVQVVQADVKE